jgi:hypothetical protein
MEPLPMQPAITTPHHCPDVSAESDTRWRWLKRVTVAFLLLLVAATWRLWTPQADFPQVPLFGWVRMLPTWVDWLAFVVLTPSLVGTVMARADSWLSRWGWLALAVTLIVLVIMDQHRLQPWAYQFGLMALAFATLPPRCGLAWVRVLVVSIYVYSAVSKLDVSFCDTLGQRFLEALLPPIGLSMSLWSEATRRGLALVFPVFELLIAAGLCFQRTRRVALVGSIVMHAVMLLILGPWGLGHRPGVLIWNMYFIVQNVVLFGRRSPLSPGGGEGLGVRGELPHAPLAPHPPTPSPRSGERGRASDANGASTAKRVGDWFTQSVFVLAIVLPFLEPWGLCDNWLAWGLYATHGARASVFVHEAAVDQLPASAREFVVAEPGAAPWVRLKLDRLSLAALEAPIYPAPRFDIGCALAIAEAARLDNDQLRVRLEGPADRWTGRRSTTDVVGVDRVRAVADGFWLNARPRDTVGH